MTKKDLLLLIKDLPDEGEIRITERGGCYDWTPTNIYYNNSDGRIYIRNYTNKQVKRSKYIS